MDVTVRRILLIAAFCLLIVLAALTFAIYLSTDTIGYSQKCGPAGCWGYSLERGKFVKRSTLRFWGPRKNPDLEYDLPPGRIERLSDDRWLAVDRAVYIDIRLTPATEPNGPGARVRILYDFQRGELHVASPLPLWRVPDFRSSNPARNWLTNDQLDALIFQIEP